MKKEAEGGRAWRHLLNRSDSLGRAFWNRTERLDRGFPKRLEGLWLLAGGVCWGIILVLLAGCGEYPDRLADNRYLLLFVLVFFVLAGFVYLFLFFLKKSLCAPSVFWLAVGYLTLFLVQLVWVQNVYFYTGWDVGMLKDRVEWIRNGGTMAGMSIDVGYSIYPNNLLLFYLFCLIEKVGVVFSMEEPYHLCIYLSCLSVNLSCFLGHLILLRFTRSVVVRSCYLLAGGVVILFSPWIMIPYSDTFGMLFVMLGMWGLLCVDNDYLKWVVVAFASVIGYSIKPTCIFPLFAAYLIAGVRYIFSLRKRWKELCGLVLCTMLFWGMGSLIPLWIQHAYSFKLLPQCRITYTHYLMMGINDQTGGGFNFDDLQYSSRFPDVAARQQGNMEEFSRRLEALMAEGKLAQFFANKALINFNDGTFAWAGEGNFYAQRGEHDNVLWEWFCETFVPPGVWESQGKFYPLYRTVMQVFWLLILTGIVLAGMDRKRFRGEKACMMIVLSGLMVFVMLFEARARYLYLYAPVFLVLSLAGYEGMWRRLGVALACGYRTKARITETKSE